MWIKVFATLATVGIKSLQSLNILKAAPGFYLTLKTELIISTVSHPIKRELSTYLFTLVEASMLNAFKH